MRTFYKILIGGVVLGAGYAAYRYFRPKRTDSLQEEQVGQGQGSGSGSGGSNPPTGNTLSYANAMYGIFAEQIWDAAHTNNFTGTQEEEIYAVFKQMRNDADIAKLVSAFGSRRMYLSFSKGALKEWIRAEMDDDEIAVINSILQKNKISYRF
jgi:hypothetical protein